MRVSIFAQQLIKFGYSPLYILGIEETLRSLNGFIREGKVKYRVRWADEENNESRNVEQKQQTIEPKYKKRSTSRQKSPPPCQRSPPTRQKFIHLKREKLREKEKDKIENSDVKFRFRDLKGDAMIEYLEKVGQGLLAQI